MAESKNKEEYKNPRENVKTVLKEVSIWSATNAGRDIDWTAIHARVNNGQTLKEMKVRLA